jgi:hypothetical protein
LKCRHYALRSASISPSPPLLVGRVEQELATRLSTLERYVEALGGKLEIHAVFDDDDVKLTACSVAIACDARVLLDLRMANGPAGAETRDWGRTGGVPLSSDLLFGVGGSLCIGRASDG